MNCLEHQELASLFLDGKLEPRRQVELFKHIAQCDVCQSFVNTMSKVNEIKDKEEVLYPSTLDDRFLMKLAERRTARLRNNQKESIPDHFWKRRVALSVPFAVAAIVLAILGGVMIGSLWNRTSEEKMLLALQQQSIPQPSAVIMVYNLPPIEVIGKPILKQARYDTLFQY